MKTFILNFIFLILFMTFQVNGQVAINSDGSAPNSSAMLDVTSTSRGLLPPRMTSSQKGAISSPSNGLLIYQTDSPIGYYFYDDSQGLWRRMGMDIWNNAGSSISYSNDVGIGASANSSHRLYVTRSVSADYVAYFENSNNAYDAYGIKIRAAQDDGTKNTENRFIGFFQGTSFKGAVAYDGAGSLILKTGSDRRLKTNIHETIFSLNDLMKIQVRDFNWIDSNQPSTGFIAQELNEVYPMAVSIPEDDKEFWMISTQTLIPLLVKSVQDQQKIINSQDVKIKSLEDRIIAIENSLAK